MIRLFLVGLFILTQFISVIANNEKFMVSKLSLDKNVEIDSFIKDKDFVYHSFIDSKGIFKTVAFIWDKRKPMTYNILLKNDPPIGTQIQSATTSYFGGMQFSKVDGSILSDSSSFIANDEYKSIINYKIKLDTLSKELFFYWWGSDNSEVGGKPTFIKPLLSKGNLMPSFSVTTLDNQKISLESLKGKYIFLDFWGTWCVGCREELPYVKKLREEIKDDKLFVLGICADTEEKILEYLKNDPLNYPNAIMEYPELEKLGIRGYPTKILISPSGEILDTNFIGQLLIGQVKGYLK